QTDPLRLLSRYPGCLAFSTQDQPNPTAATELRAKGAREPSLGQSPRYRSHREIAGCRPAPTPFALMRLETFAGHRSGKGMRERMPHRQFPFDCCAGTTTSVDVQWMAPSVGTDNIKSIDKYGAKLLKGR